MSPELRHVLLLAGEGTLHSTLLDSLSAAGFCIEEASSAEQALAAARTGRFQLVLIDLGLAGGSGIETCRQLRDLFPELGILTVRSGGTPKDDMSALDAGADDCIAAPFRFREMVARMSAVLRRGRVQPHADQAVLRAGDLELDIPHRRLRRADKEVHLSRLEFDLLLFLMKNQEIPLTHMKLLRGVWKRDFAWDPGYLRSYIRTLRGKIEIDPANPDYILTEPWVGYRFHDPRHSM